MSDNFNLSPSEFTVPALTADSSPTLPLNDLSNPYIGVEDALSDDFIATFTKDNGGEWSGFLRTILKTRRRERIMILTKHCTLNNDKT